MTRINLGEMNESLLFSQAERYKQDAALEVERKKAEKTTPNSNETAKREMAEELMLQGFSEEAICRILNITAEQLPEPQPLER